MEKSPDSQRQIIEAMKEMRLGARSGWTIPRPEGSRATRIAGFPKGEQRLEELSAEKLKEQIEFLKNFEGFVEEVFKDNESIIKPATTVADLLRHASDFREYWETLSSLMELDFGEHLKAEELPQAIAEMIEDREIILGYKNENE